LLNWQYEEATCISG